MQPTSDPAGQQSSSTRSRHALDEAEAELRRVLGPPPSGEQAERRRRYWAARDRGGSCGRCGRALEDGEPVWMVPIYLGIGWSATFFGTREIWWQGPVGVECRPARHDGYGPLERCAGCFRGVYYPERPFRWRRSPFDRLWAHCSARCAWTARNRRRSQDRAAARTRACTVCGQPFTPARSDAVTCSPACRQRAYRRRVRSAPA